MMPVETIKDIGVISGTVLSVITLFSVTVKPIRNRIMSWIRNTSQVEKTDKLIIDLKNSFDKFSEDIKMDISQLKEDSDLNRKANKCICSNRIINAYEKYKDADAIPSGEMDSLIEHYDIYHTDLGGNGKVEYKFNELSKKPIRSG